MLILIENDMMCFSPEQATHIADGAEDLHNNELAILVDGLLDARSQLHEVSSTDTTMSKDFCKPVLKLPFSVEILEAIMQSYEHDTRRPEDNDPQGGAKRFQNNGSNALSSTSNDPSRHLQLVR